VVAFARVGWDEPRGVRANIEVRVLGKGSERWTTRGLSFSSVDPVGERWRAAGFAVATVVGDIISEGESSAPLVADGAGDLVPPDRTKRTGSRDAFEGRPRWWLDGDFSLGTGAQSSPPEVGGELSLSASLDPGRWFLVGTLAFSNQEARGVDILRTAVSFGVAVAAPRVGNRFDLSLRVQPRVEYIDGIARDASGAFGQAGRWTFGLGQSFDVAWMSSERFGLVVGAELREVAGPTDFDVHGRLIAVLPAFDFVFHAGVRYGLP
jgi:hypothetical protein